jgi:threonine/homoserine/homoserine lactone efflux protein
LSSTLTAERLPQRTERHLFIDLYRTGVILLMLEGHTFRTFLPAPLQTTQLFQFHEFIHGLSAPAFLFGAGLTFIISTRRRWEEYHHWGAPLARRVRRLLLVLFLGFAIHLPYFSIRKVVLDATASDYLQLFQCDVLHCIGLGLLALHGLVFFFKKESRFYGMVLSAIITVCFLTPLIWDIDPLPYLPAAAAQMVNGLHGSPFPLFPYVGFLFAGVIVSWEFLLAAGAGRQRQFMGKLAIIGCALAAAGIVLDVLPIQIYPTYNYWYTSPNYFILRIGTLLVLTAAFWYAAPWFKKAPTALTVLGRESLFVYVLHLILLYGSAVNPSANLQVRFGQRLTTPEIAGVFLIFTAAICLAALGWSYLKERRFHLYRIVQLAGGAVFLYLLFTRDF